MKIARFVLCLVVGIAAGVTGCKASVEGKLETAGEDRSPDLDEPIDSRATPNQASSTESQGVALLGARQDLAYRGPATTQCKCLAVALGGPADAAFQWSAARPAVSASSQLVVALSSKGVACPEAGGSAPGASYWGYEVVGDDVVVVVEAASPSHPLASGAIIPRPSPGGQVYVRPLDKSLPYGLPATGGGTKCRVGVPAQAPGAAPPFVNGPAATESAATESAATESSGTESSGTEPAKAPPVTKAPPKLKGIKP